MSSSAIGFTTITSGPTGPIGNVGNRGPTGPDGATSGNIGSIGPLAPHIANVSFYSAGATVSLSDGTLFSALGAFGGATTTQYTTVQTVDYLDPLVDTLTYSFISSGEGTNSFVMRGISGSGSLVVTEDSQAIYIDSIYSPLSGLVDSASLVDNTLIYLKANNQISSTAIGITTGAFYDGALNFERSATTPSFAKLLPRAKVKYVQPRYKTENPLPITLNVNDAGVFYVRTPNGISGFNGEFKNSEVVSFTLITESDDIWHFPTNVFFENGENYLTCGKSIVNLTSFDQGTSWFATVAARGVDGTTFNCDYRSVVGSCCYDGLTGLNCKDFITKNECDAIAGTFNPLRSCDTACGGQNGVCCSNGKCLENVSYSECLAFGGKFFRDITCGTFSTSTDPNASNADRLCFDGCKEPVACCKDGTCLGDNFTSTECQLILGGTPFPGKQCSEIDCCIQNVKIGACCSGGLCSQATLVQCNEANGVFLGEGESCDSVNCGCFPDAGVPHGTCCQCVTSPNGNILFTCFVTTQANCENPSTWSFDPNLRAGDNCPASEISNCRSLGSDFNCVEEQGKCCHCDPDAADATGCFITTRSTCRDFNGIFTPNNFDCNTPCDPCAIPCSDCQPQTPGVKCTCVNNVRTCEEILDVTDPSHGCGSNGVVCTPNASCAESPCTTSLPLCVPSGCISESESDECPGTTDITTGSTCADCFQGGIIPENSGEIDYLDTFRQRAIEGPDTTSAIFITSTNVFQNAATQVLVNTCPLNTANPNIPNATQATVYGYGAKDYYIPIKSEYICNNGNDLQFCIEIDINQENSELVNSIRAYVLRTWYPKYFSTNMAAFQGLTLLDGPSIQFLNPATPFEESSVWGSLGRFSTTNLPFNEGQGFDRTEYYHNLGSFITENGFDHINIVNTPSEVESGTVNLNTVRMIEELNCPLYGLNPRGRYMDYNRRSVDVAPGSIFTGLTGGPASVRNSPGVAYALGASYENLFYYQSVNIGGRFGLQTPSLPGDEINVDGINFQYFDSDNRSGNIGYISKNIPSVTSTPIGEGHKLRTYGYTDIGLCAFCRTSVDNETTAYLQYDANDNFTINSIGYYPMQASLNRFANTFINRRLFVETQDTTNDTNAEFLIPYGFSNPGHPLMVDYESDLNITQSGSGPGGSSSRDVMQFNAANPYNNTANAGQINRSPIYKTRYSSIICDSGAIDIFGNYIPDYNYDTTVQNGHAPKLFAKKRKVIGAIDNPWYASLQGNVENGGVGPSNAETVISKTATGVKLCIKLKNFRDYILTDDQIPSTFNDSYDSLMDPTNPRNKRFLKYKNSLRLVIFSNAHNSFADDLSFGVQGPSTQFTELNQVCGEYTGRVYFDINNLQNKNTIRYGCNNTSCSCSAPATNEGTCNSCNINDEDKKTNGYGSTDLQSLVCAILGKDTRMVASCARCVKTIGASYGIGGGRELGSMQRCTCAPPDPVTCNTATAKYGISASFNCRNCSHGEPCSCKTATLNATFPVETGTIDCPAEATCEYCSETCTIPPGSILPPYNCLLVRNCGKCPVGCNIFGLLGEETSGGVISKGTTLVRDFFEQYGYVEGTDYWFAPGAFTLPMVFWKLLVDINVESSIPMERYNFPVISPPASFVFDEVDAAFYYRSSICDPVTIPPHANTIENCGISGILSSFVSCSHFCERNGNSCTPTINSIDQPSPPPETTTFIRNQNFHLLDFDTDGRFEPEINLLTSIGSECPTGANNFTSAASKKIFISETEFICVDMDCFSIDCTQFEDCAS